jgi:periplasmic divalent cation tolerance protein
MSNEIVVFCACASAEEAEKIALHLLERRLAACINVVPGVRSYYRWQGVIESAAEFLMLIKSSAELFAELEASIRDRHSYEVPEVVALPVSAGSDKYLEWLRSCLGGAA